MRTVVLEVAIEIQMTASALKSSVMNFTAAPQWKIRFSCRPRLARMSRQAGKAANRSPSTGPQHQSFEDRIAEKPHALEAVIGHPVVVGISEAVSDA